MSYIDGFVLAVPTANKQAFIDHANAVDALFLEFGATRVVEGWGDDLKHGTTTDFFRAVKATDDESVVFSWIEWPDKATRDAAMEKMRTDARMMATPMPFDGKRMIFGGFEPIVEAMSAGSTGYIDGFVTPVTPHNRDAYVTLEEKMAAKFLAVGARRFSEHWGDDVPEGKVTDFRRSVQATGDEVPVFCWVEWPDKAARNAGWGKIMADMDMPPAAMPFDGKRMIYGGFENIFCLEK